MSTLKVYNLIRSFWPLPLPQLMKVTEPKPVVPHPGTEPREFSTESEFFESFEEMSSRIKSLLTDTTSGVQSVRVDYHASSSYTTWDSVEETQYLNEGIWKDGYTAKEILIQTPERWSIVFTVKDKSYYEKLRAYNAALKAHQDSKASQKAKTEANKLTTEHNARTIGDFSSQFNSIWRLGFKALNTNDTTELQAAINKHFNLG